MLLLIQQETKSWSTTNRWKLKNLFCLCQLKNFHQPSTKSKSVEIKITPSKHILVAEIEEVVKILQLDIVTSVSEVSTEEFVKESSKNTIKKGKILHKTKFAPTKVMT